VYVIEQENNDEVSLDDAPDLLAILQDAMAASPYAALRSEVDKQFWALLLGALEDKDSTKDAEYAELVQLTSPKADQIISLSEQMFVLADIIMALCHTFLDVGYEEYAKEYIADFKRHMIDKLIDMDKDKNEEDSDG
jgi:hypothetical protein